MTHEAGKGDTQRPTNWDHFSENFDRIFGKKVPPDVAAEINQQLQDALAEDVGDKDE